MNLLSTFKNNDVLHDHLLLGLLLSYFVTVQLNLIRMCEQTKNIFRNYFMYLLHSVVKIQFIYNSHK